MNRISDRFLQLGVLAALIGMTMGVVKGAKEDFTLAPAHAHLNLLGWASMMIYGLFYRIFPSAGRGWLAFGQFWLALTGLVVLIPSLALELLGNHQAMAAVGLGSLLTLLSMAFFAAIVVGATRETAATTTRAAA